MRIVGAGEEMEGPRQCRCLSDHDAFSLMDASHIYWDRNTACINDQHKTVIVAEEMAREGLMALADDMMLIHDAMKQFSRGDFRAASSLAENSILDQIHDKARGTRFEDAVDHITNPLRAFAEVFERFGENGSGIDWAESAGVLARMKREKFPGDLTMVEKLDQWQQGRQGRTPGTC